MKFNARTKPEETIHDPGFHCLATGDPYKDPVVAGLRKFVKDGFTKGGHDYNFKPAKTVTHAKTGLGAAYENMPNGPPKKRKTRDDDGEVIIEERNFFTNPMKRGRTASVVFEAFPYKGDDYNSKRK